jgi:hypothetical protein
MAITPCTFLLWTRSTGDCPELSRWISVIEWQEGGTAHAACEGAADPFNLLADRSSKEAANPVDPATNLTEDVMLAERRYLAR